MIKQLHLWLSNKYFFKKIAACVEENSTVLELGAGKSSYLRKIGKKNISITALDIFEPSLNKAKINNVYNNYVLGDVLEIHKLFRDNSFDYVVAFDLIEHLPKNDGLNLINNMSKIACRAIILYTPNGFLPQSSFDNNKNQKHLSGWKYSEMKKKGFRVYGINGLKSLRGEFGLVRIKPSRLGLFVSDLSWLILKGLKLDCFHFSILCIKYLNK